MRHKCGDINITFSDGSVFSSKESTFTESSTVVTQFKNWGNLQLSYWLVGHRGLDHFPDEFILNIMDSNVTGAQLIDFNFNCLHNLGLWEPVFKSQLKTILSRFKTA
jgi:hypothetical protein